MATFVFKFKKSCGAVDFYSPATFFEFKNETHPKILARECQRYCCLLINGRREIKNARFLSRLVLKLSIFYCSHTLIIVSNIQDSVCKYIPTTKTKTIINICTTIRSSEGFVVRPHHSHFASTSLSTSFSLPHNAH